MKNLNKYGVEVLRLLNGEDVPGWVAGAAMWNCCSYLVQCGYAKGHYEITEAGKKYLEDI